MSYCKHHINLLSRKGFQNITQSPNNTTYCAPLITNTNNFIDFKGKFLWVQCCKDMTQNDLFIACNHGLVQQGYTANETTPQKGNQRKMCYEYECEMSMCYLLISSRAALWTLKNRAGSCRADCRLFRH